MLIEFLSSPREVADPVNRTGEEAVISAAARALVDSRDDRVLPRLLELAKRQPLAGVIDALGSYRRAEAIPCLITALSEDYSRRAAEVALLRMGPKARPALLRSGLASGAIGGMGIAIEPQSSPQRGPPPSSNWRFVPTTIPASGSDGGRRC